MRRILFYCIVTVTACASFAQALTLQSAAPASPPQSGASNRAEARPAAHPKAEDCGCEGKTPPGVVAIVNGVQVTLNEVDETIKARIESLREQVVEARKNELNLQINSRLLEAEAKKRGISTTKLIDQEIITRTPEPTEADALSFYEKNKSQIQGDYTSLKADIINYIRDQRQREEARKFAKRLRAANQVKVLVETATTPGTESDKARVFATVNGQEIRSADIEEALSPMIYSVQKQVYDLRKQQLDLKVNDILLEQEAQKRKVTTKALLEAEVRTKIKPVSEADAQQFYDQNKDRLSGEFAQIKAPLIQYLERQQQSDLETVFAEQLRKGSTLQVFLTAPNSPIFKIAVDDQPVKGAATAPVTIVEFTDFECPSCARTQPVLEQVVKDFNGKVKLIVKDFPLDQHKNAFKAAEAAEAAREQGKYWEYVDLLFKNQVALSADKLKEYASQLGLDRKRFDEALDSSKFAEKVQKDMQEAYKLGVNSTPTVFLNGRLVSDKSYDSLKAAVEAALKEPASSR